MKKTIAFILTLCTLLCTLTACHSRRNDIIEKYSDTESSTVESDGTDEAFTDDMTIPEDIREASVSFYHGNPYANMTKQELEELYQQTHNVSYEEEVNNTPYYYIFYGGEGGRAFSKLTGEMVPLCKDPLCDHTQCPFSSCRMASLAVSESKVYVLVQYTSKENVVLYEADLSFDHLSILYTWPMTDMPGNLYYHNGKLYYAAPYRVKGKTQQRVFVFDIEQKQVALLEEGDEPRFKHFDFVAGRYLYYTTYNEDNDGSYFRRYDLDTGEDICAVPASFLHPEDGDLGLILHHAEPDGIHLGIYVLRQGSDGYAYDAETYRYNIETGEYVLSSNGPVSGGYVVDWVNHRTEEYKDDPFYDYYVNNEGPYGKECVAGGELIVYEKDGRILVGALRFTTDDIPDFVCVNGKSYGYDGRFIYLEYMNYKGFQNEMNPNFNPYAQADPEWVKTVQGTMLIDVARMKVFNIGPDHQVEWIPAQ